LPDDVFSTVGSRMAMRKGSVSQPIQHILQPSRPPFADSSQDRHFILYHRRLPESNITVSHLHDGLFGLDPFALSRLRFGGGVLVRWAFLGG
jgi:hypothetical protein